MLRVGILRTSPRLPDSHQDSETRPSRTFSVAGREAHHVRPLRDSRRIRRRTRTHVPEKKARARNRRVLPLPTLFPAQVLPALPPDIGGGRICHASRVNTESAPQQPFAMCARRSGTPRSKVVGFPSTTLRQGLTAKTAADLSVVMVGRTWAKWEGSARRSLPARMVGLFVKSRFRITGRPVGNSRARQSRGLATGDRERSVA